MKLFTPPRKEIGGPGTVGDVQSAPMVLSAPEVAPPESIKVDLAYRFGALLLVAGWSTAPAELGLCAGEQELRVQTLRVPRPDVAKHFGLAAEEQVGFVLFADDAGSEPVALSWRRSDSARRVGRPLAFETRPSLSPAEQSALAPALGRLALELPPHSPAWLRLMREAPLGTAPCRSAKGFLEGAAACEQAGTGVVVGWVVHTPGARVWLEHDGGTYSLDHAFRRFRQDVHDAVGQDFGHASREAGFVARVPHLKPGRKVQLKSVSEEGVHVLSETSCAILPVDAVAAAQWLFSIGTPISDLHRRVPVIDEPVLGPLIEQRLASWRHLPVQTKTLGSPPKSPAVGIIVPLFGRADFFEHQLIEFYRDPWLLEHAELIYVLDDPRLAESFPGEAEALYRLYGVPFTWVWGGVNRGFSGANNLGAAHARAETLVFLNSDAFPQGPGWVAPLVDVLARRPDIGVVGPRLVFADGSIQHAGMEFMRRDEFGVWVNHHPRMGLSPSLDPHTELTLVPAVTGACLAMRRADLERVGGWDTGYLIGDFEDSDLCMKLRAVGLASAYLPSVQLTHLERQSFRLIGQDGDFRMRVVIYNAVRHQTRWGAVLGSANGAAAEGQSS